MKIFYLFCFIACVFVCLLSAVSDTPFNGLSLSFSGSEHGQQDQGEEKSAQFFSM